MAMSGFAHCPGARSVGYSPSQWYAGLMEGFEDWRSCPLWPVMFTYTSRVTVVAPRALTSRRFL